MPYTGDIDMKIRNGFVSNSSSSSFVVQKKDLTPFQIEAIIDFNIVAEKMGWIESYEDENGDFVEGCGYKDDGAWAIKEDETIIMGETYIDNFSMRVFFDKLVIPRDVVKWTD